MVVSSTHITCNPPPSSSSSITHNNLTPEVQRALARRSRDEARLTKLHSARLRNVGADIMGIQNQISDKRASALAEKVEAQAQARVQEDIRRTVAQIEQDERVQRQAQACALRRDWQLQQAQKQTRELVDTQKASQDVIKPEACGVGAAQKFDGEDEAKEDRERLQALQIRDWNAALVREKQRQLSAAAAEAVEEAKQVELLVRVQEDQEDRVHRRATCASVEMLHTNERLAKAKCERLAQAQSLNEAEKLSEVALANTSALLTEDLGQGRSALYPNTRVRPDHWKGMTQDQVREILASNAELSQDKVRELERESQARVSELRAQEQLKQELERQEWQALRERQRVEAQVRQTLAQQQVQAREREARQAQMSKGKIESGFFDSFGKSYR